MTRDPSMPQRSLPRRPGFICGFPCRYGGTSSARKFSRATQGVIWHCNRRVRVRGSRCYEHDGVAVPAGFSISPILDVGPERGDVAVES